MLRFLLSHTDNVLAIKGWNPYGYHKLDKPRYRIMTLKNDSGLYQAQVVWCNSDTVAARPAFQSVYCNDIIQALESLLEITQEQAWEARGENE